MLRQTSARNDLLRVDHDLGESVVSSTALPSTMRKRTEFINSYLRRNVEVLSCIAFLQSLREKILDSWITRARPDRACGSSRPHLALVPLERAPSDTARWTFLAGSLLPRAGQTDWDGTYCACLQC